MGNQRGMVLSRELFHQFQDFGMEFRFQFDTNAGGFMKPCPPLVDRDVIRKTAKGVKYPRITFRPSQLKSCGRIQSQLVPAVRDQSSAGPAMVFEYFYHF